MLARAMALAVAGPPVAIPLLQRFRAVLVMDSTQVRLPASVQTVWAGCGGSHPVAGAASLKVQLRLDLCAGRIDVLTLHDGKASDQRAPSQTPAQPGSLRLSDQGYFAIPVFRATVAAGAHFLTRPSPRLTGQAPGQARKLLGAFPAAQPGPRVDRWVTIGVAETMACRLLAVRAPAGVVAERQRKEHAAARREGRTARQSVLELTAWTVVLTSAPLRTPLPGVYLATMAHVYPQDRGQNYSLALGERVAEQMLRG